MTYYLFHGKIHKKNYLFNFQWLNIFCIQKICLSKKSFYKNPINDTILLFIPPCQGDNRMSVPPLSPAQRFGQFTGEFCTHLGNALGQLETVVVSKIHAISETNPAVKDLLGKMDENKEKIAHSIFFLGCLYNFWRSPILFTTGTLLGISSSVSNFPISFTSLRNGELFSLTEKDGYAATKIMGCVTLANMYLGNTLLDDTFLGMFAGLIAGNSLYYRVGTPIGEHLVYAIGLIESYGKIAFNMLSNFPKTEPAE